jgi:hypothetical protein
MTGRIEWTIIPILRRELTAASRSGKLQGQRATFAAILLIVVLGTFAAWYFPSGQVVGRYMLSQVAGQTFICVFVAHAMSLMSIMIMGCLTIAAEMDCKTLGFLLATRLSNAEIVLSKLAACGVLFLTGLAAGLPVVILLYTLGGVHPGLILFAYGGLCSTAFLVLAIGTFVSSGAPDGRRAVSAALLWVMAWSLIPVFVGMTPILSRLGIRPPGFVMTLNAWVLASNPLALLPVFARGNASPGALYHNIGWMSALQLGGGIVLILGAIARLRSAFRVNMGGDGAGLAGKLHFPVWRFRPRPPVSDDPIFWRERYTTTGNLIAQLAGMCVGGAVLAALTYFTFFFARRAFIELWNHGYTTAATSAGQPEFNIIERLFFDLVSTSAPLDAARMDFNIFLRFLTVPLVFMLVLGTTGTSVTMIKSEQAKDTWFSLIATPLSGRDILRSKLLACLWRLRGLSMIVLVLWILGLLSGAIHPLGYLASVLILASWIWFFLMAGMLAALQAKDHGSITMSQIFLTIGSALLPFVLPGWLNSVLWGAGSAPFLTWLSLASYRELRMALHHGVYLPLHWFRLETGEGPFWVALACLIGIVVPSLWGLKIWRYAIANFDRFVGRPWKEEPAAAENLAPQPVLVS